MDVSAQLGAVVVKAQSLFGDGNVLATEQSRSPVDLTHNGSGIQCTYEVHEFFTTNDQDMAVSFTFITVSWSLFHSLTC